MNHLFAKKAIEAVERLLQQDKDILPLVWVHDYHLTLAAAMIRKVYGVFHRNYFWQLFRDRLKCLFVIACSVSDRERHWYQAGILSSHPVSSLGHIPVASMGQSSA